MAAKVMAIGDGPRSGLALIARWAKWRPPRTRADYFVIVWSNQEHQ